MADIQQSSNLQGLLKEVYPLAMYNSITTYSQVLDLFTAYAENAFEGPEGKGYKLSNLAGGLQGIGARLEDEILPAGGSPVFLSPVVYLAYNYARLTSTYQARVNADSSRAAMANFNTSVMVPAIRNLTSDLDRQSLGAGDGILARVDGTPATTMPIDAPFGIAGDVKGWTNFSMGMTILFSPNPDGSAPRNGGVPVTVNTVSPTGNSGGGTIGISSLPSDVLDNDYIFRADAYGTNAATGGVSREMMGIEGLIDDGTVVSTLQGISRTTYNEFASEVIDASAAPYSAAFTEGLAMRTLTDLQLYGGMQGGSKAVFFCNNDVWRQAYNAIRGLGGFGAASERGGASVAAGAKGLTVQLPMGTVELRGVPRTPWGRAYCVDPSVLIKASIGKGEWVSNDTNGGIWHQVHVGDAIKDASFAYFRVPMNLGITNPKLGIKVTKINEQAY